MKVVFFEDVEGTAQVGDVKEVKNGFARNFLLPRGIAGATTQDNLSHANALAQKEARRQAKLDEEARKVSGRFDDYTVSFEARVGETGRLFGSVTNRDIAEKLSAATGVDIEPRIVLLAEPIRELGTFPVTIKFTRNVTSTVQVEVGPDEDSKEIVAKLEAQREIDRVADEAAAANAAAKAAARAEAQAEAELEAGESADADETESDEADSDEAEEADEETSDD